MEREQGKFYILVTGDFVKTGGMDRANFALAEYLARKGELVNLVAHRVANELLSYPNVRFHSVPKLANSYLLSSPLLDWKGRSLARQYAAKGSRVIVNGGNCQWGDVNWVHYVHAAYQPTSQLGWFYSGKSIIDRQLSLKTERQALQSAKIIIANSEHTQKHLQDHLAIPANKITKVYYGIDPDIFYPAHPTEQRVIRQHLGWSLERKIVVFIGALGDRRKGFDVLLTAWENLSKSTDWDADLVVIGAGAELKKWQDRIHAFGMESQVHLLGFRTDVPKLLRAADCLVAPTRYEAYGLGVHEALCCGLPALVSAQAGVAEQYPSELQELLIPNCEDAEDLAARLQKWRQAINYYRQLIIPLTNKLRSYTWDDMARNIIEHI